MMDKRRYSDGRGRAKAVKSGATLWEEYNGTPATDPQGYLRGATDLTRYENSGTKSARTKTARTPPIRSGRRRVDKFSRGSSYGRCASYGADWGGNQRCRLVGVTVLWRERKPTTGWVHNSEKGSGTGTVGNMVVAAHENETRKYSQVPRVYCC